MKNAVLHCSYSVPMRVSLAVCVFAAARAVTVFCCVAVRDTGVRVAMFLVALRGVNIETFFALRAETVVFTALRAVVDLAVFVFVVITFVLFPRDAAFSVRVADSALHMQNAQIKEKYRIFFISCLILANL